MEGQVEVDIEPQSTSTSTWPSQQGRTGMIDVRDIAEFAARILPNPALHATGDRPA